MSEKNRVLRFVSFLETPNRGGHLKFDHQDNICDQHGYWDASFAVCGEFPLLGWIMKGVRSMLKVR